MNNTKNRPNSDSAQRNHGETTQVDDKALQGPFEGASLGGGTSVLPDGVADDGRIWIGSGDS